MKTKVLRCVKNVIIIALALVSLTLLSLLLSFGPQYPEEIFSGYFDNPLILLLNFLPVAVVFLLFYCLVGRAWIAYLADCVLVLGLTFANYFFLMYRDDVLVMMDVLNLREGLKMSDAGYTYTPGVKMIFAIAVGLIFTLLMFFFCKEKLATSSRVYALTLVVLSVLCLKNAYLGDYLYDNKTDNLKYVVRWSPTQLFISKGFVYSFLHSGSDLIVSLPQDYDKDAVKTKLYSYEYDEIPEDKRVNIIGIMLEANCDLNTLGIENIDASVYEDYDCLKQIGYSGTLVNNIFAGGTIDSERAFLTGIPGLTLCRKNTNSYVRYFNDNGYVATGGHPSEEWFYNRRTVNSYLGFSNYRFAENHYLEKFSDEMRYDWNAFEDFYDQYTDHLMTSNKPYFGFYVTYQGHAPYDTINKLWETDKKPLYENENISEVSQTILNNYLGSVKNTGQNLKYFYDRIMTHSEPTVIVVFGDHKPWLGDGNSVYKELGINIDLDTKEGFLNYYSTEYIILANDAAKRVLGKDVSGKGAQISTNYLMNEVFSVLGYGGNEFMKYTNELKQTVPVYNDAALIDSEGSYQYVNSLSEKNQVVYDEIRSLNYFYKTNYIYN